MIKVPPPSDPRWKQIFQSESTFKFEFLAINMVFTRLAITARKDSSEKTLAALAGELREIFAQNAHNPKVQNDIKKIFG